MGFLMSQHGHLGAISPAPFLSVSSLESMRSGGAIPPPPQKRYLSDTCATPCENKANGCHTPLCNTISKGYCAIWGVSRTGPLRARPTSTPCRHRCESLRSRRWTLSLLDSTPDSILHKGFDNSRYLRESRRRIGEGEENVTHRKDFSSPLTLVCAPTPKIMSLVNSLPDSDR